jgi:hypothetical protein
VLFDEPGPAPRILAWHWRDRADNDRDVAGLRYAEHAKSQPAAKVSETGVGLPAVSARRYSSRKPHFVAGGGAIDRLKDEFEIETELQLTDDDERRLIAMKSEKIATADFPFDREAKALQKSLHREVERRLQGELPAMIRSY